MVPFALLASRGCSTPCGLALALAAEFAPVRPERAERALDELARAHLDAVALSNAIDDLLVDLEAGFQRLAAAR